MAGYALLETVERAVDGLGAASIIAEPVFWLGLALAPLVAFALRIATRTIEELLVSVLLGNKSLPTMQRLALTFAGSTDHALEQNELDWSISRRGPPFVLFS